MKQCTNETQRTSMKELIEMTIRKSLQDESMYTKDWKAEPLLPLYQPQSLTKTTTTTTMVKKNSNGSGGNGDVASHNHSDITSVNTSCTTRTVGKKSYASIVSNDSRIDSISSKKKKSSAAVSTVGATDNSHYALKPNPKKDDSKTSSFASSYYGPSSCSSTSFHYEEEKTSTTANNSNNNKSPCLKNPKLDASLYYDPFMSSWDQKKRDEANVGNDDDNNVAVGLKKQGKHKNKKQQLQTAKDKTSTFTTFLASEPNYISLSSHSLKKRKAATLSAAETKKSRNNAHKDGFDTSATKLASRANRFSGRGGLTTATSNDLHQEYARGVDKYMGKSVISGGGGIMSSSSSSSSNRNVGEAKKLQQKDYEKMTVKGTCQTLEKEFLRLTAPPRAELVRPQPVLEQHLKNILRLRKNIKNGKNIRSGDEKDYNWFCSQLKAIRQDMTVQRIFNAFAVKVYESHARIALEEGDVNEYNQSQTQLKELYELLSHKKKLAEGESNGLKNQNEFIAYRIIYHVFLTGNKKYEGGSSDLFKIMLHLTSEQKCDPLIIHALKVRVAVADNDYHAFFRLRNECANHGIYLLDKIVPQIRSAALKCAMKAYRPSVATDFILSQLGFALDHKRQRREAIGWLKSCGCKLIDDQSTIVAKESILDETFMAGAQKSSLI
jgi:Nuclear protein export factor